MSLIFKLVWWPWLHAFKVTKIVEIRGWRTALVDTAEHGRMCITPDGRKGDLNLWGYLFEWFKYFKPDPIWDGNYPNDRGTM